MGVPRFTTPTFTLTFSEPGLNLTQANAVYVTFKQANREVITVSGSSLTITATTIGVTLTQEQTGSLAEGPVEIQANWKVGTKRSASEVILYPITKQLLQRVV